MLNNIILQGRLVRDVELKATQTGKAVATFTIAVQRDYGSEADFLSIVAWEKTADFVSQYFHKGQEIIVQGSLSTRKYKDKDGNDRTATEVNAQKVFFCGKKEETNAEPREETKPMPQAYAQGNNNDFTVATDDDLPF